MQVKAVAISRINCGILRLVSVVHNAILAIFVVFSVSADNSTCVNRTLQWRWLGTQKFSNASVIDLQKKETARASMRKMVKHLLKKYKYPSEDYDTAISTVIIEIFISVIRSMWRGGDYAKADI